MYVDKLDGRITSASYDVKSGVRSNPKSQGKSKNIGMPTAVTWMEGGRLLELSQKAACRYEKQEMGEKRRLLNFVFSNSTWKDGRLTPNYRQPFDMLAIANTTHQKQKATEVAPRDVSEIWLLR